MLNTLILAIQIACYNSSLNSCTNFNKFFWRWSHDKWKDKATIEMLKHSLMALNIIVVVIVGKQSYLSLEHLSKSRWPVHPEPDQVTSAFCTFQIGVDVLRIHYHSTAIRVIQWNMTHDLNKTYNEIYNDAYN